MNLSTDIKYLPGVGPARAKLLGEEMGIHTFGDLFDYFPFKHIDRTRIYYIHELSGDMPFVQLKGKILSYEIEGVGRKQRLVAHFTDGHGLVDLVWFNGAKWVRDTYKEEKEYIVFGKPTYFSGSGRFNITHPEIDDANSLKLSTMGMQPYYSVPVKAAKRGLNSRTIEKLTNSLFKQCPETIPETLPQWLVERYMLMSRDSAIRAMHYPQNADALNRATYRLKLEELFYIQLNILKFSSDRQKEVHGIPCPRVGSMFLDFYHHHLPFTLTGAQQRVIKEMHADMQSGRQMNRLLQGDVGSGKTLVALLVMLLAVDNGLQACIMAPTEILAEQHLETFRQFLGDMPLRVELLTGIVKGKRRKALLEDLAAGEVNILVGTHAVIEDNVEFRNLGLVVIDEQHRFGVAQRARLWRKNTVPPHVLVMTATPIPRTLAMTLYGDLDVSVINELPPGRKPITTVHYYDNRHVSLYESIRQQISLGRQAYIVYPLIQESEKLDMKNLEEGYEIVCQVFPDYKISKVHGKMKPADKDAEMQRFANGETQILVATTVIEVGVNVPNASVMVIENAERFGLAQLHQLRGRVGRGADQSYCILVTKYELSAETKKRIQIMTETNDGFEIAEADLKFRGPGDLEGTQQSGTAFELRVANLARDGQVVQQARNMAREIIDADPDQSKPEYALLWQRLSQLGKDQQDWSSIS
ncbi:MAG: ATP-dependent DNA helicase RecG [Bacteroidaceae bacterium]|nr:ATP-dependent DNA helicase RecG [Bacteroidaceae bacterium]